MIIEPRRRPAWPWKLLRIGVLGVGLIVLAFLYWSITTPTLPPLPRPNGWDDLVRAGNAIVGVPPSIRPGAIDIESLRPVVALNHQALALARLGLNGESRVPLDFTFETMQAHMDATARLRNLGRLLFAKAKLAEGEGRLAEAAAGYLDIIRLGQRAGRGGVMIDALTGQAIEATGTFGLAGLRDRLGAEQVRTLIPSLEAIERKRESIPTVLGNEKLWQRRNVGLEKQIVLGISGMGQRLERPAIDALTMSHHRQQGRLRLLLTDLALRAYQADHRAYPDRLAELVPRYLPSVPEDPYAPGRPLSYTKGESDFLLFCIGPDGQDDGGRPVPEKNANDPKASGDLLVVPDGKP